MPDLLTEARLRALIQDQDLGPGQPYTVPADAIVTPAAREFLADRNIPLRYVQEIPPARKPEHKTALRGAVLVDKDHPVICLRGKLDSLQAAILEVQWSLQDCSSLVRDLDEVLAHVRDILRCEVTGQPLPEIRLLGLSGDELRARSHDPAQYYGLPHISPAVEHGEAVLRLNRLRTLAREAELAAYSAFGGPKGVPFREDLLRALNRLSSLFYVMMYRVLAKEYPS